MKSFHSIYHIRAVFWVVIMTMSATGCSKLITIDPPKNQLSAEQVFADSTSSVAATMAIYAKLSSNTTPFVSVYSSYIGQYTDECFSRNGTNEWTSSLLTPETGINKNGWHYLYSIIYQSNMLIEQLTATNRFSEGLSRQLIAEAKFLRAWAYFYLVNLYDHVPLVLSTDVNVTRLASQQPADMVYEQIISDLLQAKEDLPLDYAGSQKIRATKWAAQAFLARVYLYQKDWASADREATAVIEEGPFGLLQDQALDRVFLIESKEAIFHFDHVNGFVSGFSTLIPASTSSAPTNTLTTVLAESFEPGDLRRQHWVGEVEIVTAGVPTTFYYQKKYKNRTANTANPERGSGLRLAEQLLIRAESRARLGRMKDGTDDLNQVRRRAGLPDHSVPSDLNEMLTLLEQERRVELFLEWGDRFLNLKRTGRLDPIMSAYKETWISRGITLPIPLTEITYNPNLIQNAGY